MFFKVVFNKEVHVYHPKSETSFESLHNYIREVFKNLPSKYQLTYFDEEDEITLACQSDLETMQHLCQKTAKIYIKEVDESFYDETQKVHLDDEMRVQPLQEEMQELKLQSQQDNESVQSSEPLLEDGSNKPEVEIEDDIKSIEKSEQPLQSKNDQPQIIEEEKPLLGEKMLEEKNQMPEEKNFFMDQSELDQSMISRITESDIEDKFKQMLPEFMEKIKRSLLQASSVGSKKEKIVHKWVTCDECGKKNIEGVRYKCAVCANFDLCQTCEAISNHDHPFLKIKHPKQAPFKLLAVIQDDEQNSFEVNGQRVQLPQMPIVNQLFDIFGKQFQEANMNPSQCPWKQRFDRKQERKEEEKMEERCQPQKKAKVEEEKPAEKVQTKVQPKVQPKVEIKAGRIFQRPVSKSFQVMEAERKKNEKIMQNSKYIFSVMQDSVQQQDCYQFAKKYPTLQKEDLLSLYFSEKY